MYQSLWRDVQPSYTLRYQMKVVHKWEREQILYVYKHHDRKMGMTFSVIPIYHGKANCLWCTCMNPEVQLIEKDENAVNVSFGYLQDFLRIGCFLVISTFAVGSCWPLPDYYLRHGGRESQTPSSGRLTRQPAGFMTQYVMCGAEIRVEKIQASRYMRENSILFLYLPPLYA